ncbi:MAG: ribonuclease HI [Pseudomonadales bacterium]|jgi:ribonuclease HI|nr:ribonuclease HI [Pseudomonadales bacterium]
MKDEVSLYTDGACRGNPGPGGWGAILQAGARRKELSGGEAHTTNNRMELTAVIRGLQALKRPCRVLVVTDSKYVLQGMTEWLEGWKRKGWRTAAKKPVLNSDLWQELDQVAALHEVRWEWVKGHSGHPMNELADRLANRGIDELVLN